MTLRTFRQYGKAFGTEQLSMTATLGGIEIFNGPVPTALTEPEPDFSTVTWPYGDVLFTWTDDIDFVGAKEMKIQVYGIGYVMLTSTNANYICIEVTTEPAYVTIPGGPDAFNGFYSQQFDGYQAHDPYTNVVIGGTPREPDSTGQTRGQWTWIVNGGSEFVAMLNVNKARAMGT
jgi:hypothetical protein